MEDAAFKNNSLNLNSFHIWAVLLMSSWSEAGVLCSAVTFHHFYILHIRAKEKDPQSENPGEKPLMQNASRAVSKVGWYVVQNYEWQAWAWRNGSESNVKEEQKSE